MIKLRLLLVLFLQFSAQQVYGIERIPIQVQRHRVGAPITLGVPFPRGALTSPDCVRVVGHNGREILSQVTEVSTWEPAGESIKWAWVFFFAESDEKVFIEYGEDVARELNPSPRIDILNSQRDNGFIEVTTGPLRFKVKKGEAKRPPDSRRAPAGSCFGVLPQQYQWAARGLRVESRPELFGGGDPKSGDDEDSEAARTARRWLDSGDALSSVN